MEKKSIKEWREHWGMSKAYIARKLDVSPVTVSRWEQGDAIPSGTNLVMLGEVFGCGVDGIFLPSISSKGGQND